MADYSKNKDILNTFFMDCRENIDAMENGLLEIEKGDYDDEVINSIFRAAHTIKGSSGMFSFDNIEKFTHKIENLLDNVRNKTIDINSEMVSLLLECNDHIINLLDIVEDTGECKIEGELPIIQEDLINQLNKFLPQSKAEKEKASNEKKEKTIPAEGDDTNPVQNIYWHISLRFGENTYKNGMDPGSFINYLEKFVPEIQDHIEVIDAATPKTLYRYTLNSKGAAYGWAVTVDQTWSNRLSHTTPFKNLFLAGHWTNPGPGICAVVSSGWRVANMILNN